jgi:putative transposase
MKGKRYSEEQIVHILKEVERGKSIAAVAREYGVSETTIHRWRGRYRGMDQAELKRLRELETENARLKKIVADQAIDMDVLRDLLGKEQ